MKKDCTGGTAAYDKTLEEKNYKTFCNKFNKENGQQKLSFAGVPKKKLEKVPNEKDMEKKK